MNEPHSVASDYLAQSSAIHEIIDFIVDLVRCEDGFEDFVLTFQDHQALADYLLKTYPSAAESISLRLQRQMTLDGVEYLKHLQAYRDLQVLRDRKLVWNVLDEHDYPREQLTELATAINTLQPKDCMALQGWPEQRKPVDEGSGRLENAGQFIQRLFDEKLYDEEKFGKLYLFDLRTINPKLYQALVQWQKRTGNKLLANKKDEIEELLNRSGEENLDFHDTSRASNARWRRQQKAAQM